MVSKSEITRLLHHAETSEKAIEKHLRRRMASLGLPCLKYSNPGESGYPDRLVCLPNGMVLWVELKSRGERPARIQQLRHLQLQGLGHTVVTLDSRAAVDELADKITEGRKDEI